MITISYILLILIIVAAITAGFVLCSLMSSAGTYDRIQDAYNKGIEVGLSQGQESEAR